MLQTPEKKTLTVDGIEVIYAIMKRDAATFKIHSRYNLDNRQWYFDCVLPMEMEQEPEAINAFLTDSIAYQIRKHKASA